jgi:hypothetical protein
MHPLFSLLRRSGRLVCFSPPTSFIAIYIDAVPSHYLSQLRLPLPFLVWNMLTSHTGSVDWSAHLSTTKKGQKEV